jgi:hypothetical protein
MAGQIPHSETPDIYIFKIEKKTPFCCEKRVVGDLNYTILESYIWINYGLIKDAC